MTVCWFCLVLLLVLLLAEAIAVWGQREAAKHEEHIRALRDECASTERTTSTAGSGVVEGAE